MDDENDNPPSFAQMVILPDQGIRVSKDPGSSKEAPSTRLTPGTDYRSPQLYVPENVTIGAPIIRLVARDPDEGKNAEITYAILSESGTASSSVVRRYFVMDSRSGEISVAGSLPAETDIVLEVAAKDLGDLMDNVTVRIHVFDVNDHAPVFKQSWYSFDLPEGAYKRSEVGRIEAVDSDFGDNSNVTYEVIPIDPDRGSRFEITKYELSIFNELRECD